MARRKATPQRVPEAVREAVEKTIQATLGSAQQTRGRVQDAADELVRGAETSAGVVRSRVREAIDDVRPATYEDLKELRKELRAIGRRLDAIEERLPRAPAAGAKKKRPPK